MRVTVGILFVGDDLMAGDELVRRHLEPTGLQVMLSYGPTETLFRRQIMRGVDLIVWQHGHVAFAPERAIALIRELRLDVPLLVLGDDIAEATLYEYQRMGVTDVVSAGPPCRLGPAAERALNERDARIAHRRVEAALRYSETRFRLVASLISDLAYVLRVTDDGALAWEWTTVETAHIKGLTAADLPDRGGWLDLAHPEDRPIVEEHYQRLLAGGTSEVEFRVVTSDGTVCYLRDHARAEPDSLGLLIFGAVKDVTEHKRSGLALRASEARYRRIVETSLEGILMTDADQRISFANGRIVEMFGWSLDEILGQPILSFIRPEERSSVQARFEAGRTDPRQQYSLKTRRKDGSDIWIVVSASTLFGPDGELQGRLAMIADVTERRRVEEELFQAQKLESVGRLASGIAHEINTPIQFIGDNVHFLRDGLMAMADIVMAARELADAAEHNAPTAAALARFRAAEDQADLDYLTAELPSAADQTLEGVERVATIVRAMKEFAHPDHQDHVAVDLNQALQSTLIVARSELRYVADVTTEFGPLPSVLCHPSAMNQVFLNLLVNAAHAVADRPGTSEDAGSDHGRITIRTRAEGPFAVVEVEDNGCGIPEAIADKVFDQFFTTKEVGRGTGQGLALARRVVVEQHGGSLTFTSVVSQGSTFVVRLPIAGRDAACRVADATWEGRRTA